jgi:hypothetical protein
LFFQILNLKTISRLSFNFKLKTELSFLARVLAPVLNLFYFLSCFFESEKTKARKNKNKIICVNTNTGETT